ncbi:MAG: hypothetical protein BroJett006_14120 [Betaproteobacteria bacterium]|nr:MAG: hypothetical protein BroJett006_14120 [Betaproteobacteria bacterium]
MTSAEENYRLLQEIQANRDFLLLAYQQNPALLRHAEPDVRLLFGLPENEKETGAPNPCPQTDPQRK